MRPPPCTDADDLLRCSATVGYLGEMGEPDILIYKHLILLLLLNIYIGLYYFGNVYDCCTVTGSVFDGSLPLYQLLVAQRDSASCLL